MIFWTTHGVRNIHANKLSLEEQEEQKKKKEDETEKEAKQAETVGKGKGRKRSKWAGGSKGEQKCSRLQTNGLSPKEFRNYKVDEYGCSHQNFDKWVLRETLTNPTKMSKEDPGYKLLDKCCTDCTKPIITPAETAVRVKGWGWIMRMYRQAVVGHLKHWSSR